MFSQYEDMLNGMLKEHLDKMDIEVQIAELQEDDIKRIALKEKVIDMENSISYFNKMLDFYFPVAKNTVVPYEGPTIILLPTVPSDMPLDTPPDTSLNTPSDTLLDVPSDTPHDTPSNTQSDTPPDTPRYLLLPPPKKKHTIRRTNPLLKHVAPHTLHACMHNGKLLKITKFKLQFNS